MGDGTLADGLRTEVSRLSRIECRLVVTRCLISKSVRNVGRVRQKDNALEIRIFESEMLGP